MNHSEWTRRCQEAVERHDFEEAALVSLERAGTSHALCDGWADIVLSSAQVFATLALAAATGAPTPAGPKPLNLVINNEDDGWIDTDNLSNHKSLNQEPEAPGDADSGPDPYDYDEDEL